MRAFKTAILKGGQSTVAHERGLKRKRMSDLQVFIVEDKS